MITTKKLPVAVSFAEFSTRADEFLVPANIGGKSSFIGIKSGKSFPYGALSYLGKSVSADSILEKLAVGKVSSDAISKEMLESYLEAISAFKIGNILAVESVTGSLVRLKKVADMIPVGGKVNLP
jgi:hypothetical protein